MATIQFRLNGQATTLETDGDRTLLWVLRTDLGLTGTKYGCGEAHCGACTVIVDGFVERSCQTAVADVAGKEVITVEGLAAGDNLHPLQEAFAEHGAFQCGFCTSGMIMSAYGLLRDGARPSREEIVAGMDDNLCRCSAYKRILAAIEDAAGKVAAR